MTRKGTENHHTGHGRDCLVTKNITLQPDSPKQPINRLCNHTKESVHIDWRCFAVGLVMWYFCCAFLRSRFGSNLCGCLAAGEIVVYEGKPALPAKYGLTTTILILKS